MAHSTHGLLWRLAQAGALIALFTGAASAQVPGLNLAPTDRPLTKEDAEKRQATEDAYKSALQKIPNKENRKPVDPWENMRPNPPTSSKTRERQQ
jgi:hypothetical protein